MSIDELAKELGVEVSYVKKSVRANGFEEDEEYSGKESHLIELYVDYMEAMDEAKEQRVAFQYSDGEESVNKSGVYDQYRRYAMDLFSAWSSAKREYDDEQAGLKDFFTVRGRGGGVLNARTR